MFNFDKLTPAAKRAAFAHMGKTAAAKKVIKAVTHKKPGASKGPDLTKRYQNVGLSGGNLQDRGTISAADAAAVMFGPKGAQQRIAKAKKARARKSK